MTQQTRYFFLTVLSVISTQSLFANSPHTNNEAFYRQNQMQSDNQNFYHYQSSPNTTAEHSFMLESHIRLDQIQQENRNMIEQDRKMIREGYDPNESYYNYDSRVRHTKEQYDPNNPYQNQEQILRGELRGHHQASDADRSVNYLR